MSSDVMLFMFPVCFGTVKFKLMSNGVSFTFALSLFWGDDLASGHFQINKIRNKKLTSFFAVCLCLHIKQRPE